MRICTLSSGSRGNATFVAHDGTRILVDAGLSLRELTRRLTCIGEEVEALDAVLVTHEHGDHIGCVEKLAAAGLPVYMTWATVESSRIGNLNGSYREIAAGEAFALKALRISPVPIPHDTPDPVAFVIASDAGRVGICTDLGMLTEGVVAAFSGLDGLILEANHDERMVRDNPDYPRRVKERILSSQGHLSNHATAAMLKRVAHDRLQWVQLAHLSAKNNTPALAHAAAMKALDDARCTDPEMPVFCAGQDAPGPVMTVSRAGI